MFLPTRSFTLEKTIEHSSYKWVIMLVAITSTMLSSISRQSFSIMFADVLLTAPPSQVTWIFNLSQFLSDSSALVLGPLCQEFGYRVFLCLGGILFSIGTVGSAFVTTAKYLFITYSVITGTGCGIIIYVSYVGVPEFFLTQQGLATSLLYSGSSVGQLIGPLLVNILQSEIGYFWTILMMGALFANVCPLAVLFHPATDHEITPSTRKMSSVYTISYTTEELKVTRPPCLESQKPTVGSKPPDSSKAITFFRNFLKNFYLIRSLRACIISISLAIISMTYSNFLAFIPLAMNDAGASLEEGAMSLTVASISMVVGRLIIPGIYDFLSIPAEWYFKMGALLMSISMFAFTMFEDRAISYLCLLIFGLMVGCTSSFRPLLCIEILGFEKLPALYAVNGVLTSLVYLLGGAALGALAKAFGNYIFLIRVLSGTTLISFCLWLLMPFATVYDRRREITK